MQKNTDIFLKLIFKINGLIRSIHRFVIRNSVNSRPSSYPYISGDSFRSIADHVFEDKKNFNKDQVVQNSIFEPEKVKQGDVVFVETRNVTYFFQNLHPKIKYGYILITHNSDVCIDSNLANFIDGKIIKWFGQNVTINHPKIIPIPIGLENLYYFNNGIIKYFDFFKNKIVDKSNEILFGFSIETNMSERAVANSILQTSLISKEIKFKLNSFNYLKLLNKYKFVASPPGNGLDCHRTWEAMYLKVIPIVKRSVAVDYFYSIGLPLWIVDSWDEIKNLNYKDLEEKYNLLKSRFDNKALFMDYWINQIRTVC